MEIVGQFGNSGLLQHEDNNVYRQKMALDWILTSLSTDSAIEQEISHQRNIQVP